jgi:fructoselysine-6-P-deglycase FrlB-like protein
MTMTTAKPPGLMAIELEMERQISDALLSIRNAEPTARTLAASLKKTGRLLMLGMGASHAAGRALEPHYRALGIDAIAIPISEQLGAPLVLEGRTIIIASQSGESAEVVRWLSTVPHRDDVFGVTIDGNSTLAKSLPCLIGAGGTEKAFAATRSLTLTFALHLPVMAALGLDPASALQALNGSIEPDLGLALAAFAHVESIVTSGRMLQGLAEAIALGLTELSRLPCFSLEGGQLRHGPMEMLGPKIGVVLFRAREDSAPLVANMAQSAQKAGSPVILFDASGEAPVAGVTTIALPTASGFAAIFAILPHAQRFMVHFAAARVPDVGSPRRSAKITREE